MSTNGDMATYDAADPRSPHRPGHAHIYDRPRSADRGSSKALRVVLLALALIVLVAVAVFALRMFADDSRVLAPTGAGDATAMIAGGPSWASSSR